jgi:hypothetical protein
MQRMEPNYLRLDLRPNLLFLILLSCDQLTFNYVIFSFIYINILHHDISTMHTCRQASISTTEILTLVGWYFPILYFYQC